MTDSKKNATIHSKEYYRVVLEGIDAKRETPDSFAIKLSMRTRTPLPRTKLVATSLPCTLKGDLSEGQANTFKRVIEEIGGEVRVEAYVKTFAEARAAEDLRSPGDPGRGEGLESYDDVGESGARAFRPRESETTEMVVCPDCGWEQKYGATHCPLCLRRFRDTRQRPKTLRDRIPDENPLALEMVKELDDDARGADVSFLKRYQLPILLGSIAVLVLILLISK